MSAPFKIGDAVDIVVDGITKTATVKTYRIAGNRQILTLADDAGQSSTLVVELARDKDGNAAVLVPPADIAAARTVALAVLAGQPTRLPVAQEANLLASALVALTGGAA